MGFTNKKAQIQTENGVISVYTSINDFGSLTASLKEGPAREEPKPESQIPFEALPEERVFTYRWSLLHLFSFVWLGTIALMAFQFSQSKQKGDVIFYFGFAAFASIGIWMQLTGWNETIKLGPNGIIWTDFLGRTRVNAQLKEIVSVNQTMAGNRTSSFQIATKVGTVRFSSYLRGYSDLVDQIRVILDSSKA